MQGSLRFRAGHVSPMSACRGSASREISSRIWTSLRWTQMCLSIHCLSFWCPFVRGRVLGSCRGPEWSVSLHRSRPTSPSEALLQGCVRRKSPAPRSRFAAPASGTRSLFAAAPPSSNSRNRPQQGSRLAGSPQGRGGGAGLG